MPDEPGLTDVLVGKATLEDVLRTGEDGLPDLVPAGTAGTLDASAVHGSPVLVELLRTLGGSYDVSLSTARR